MKNTQFLGGVGVHEPMHDAYVRITCSAALVKM